MLSRVRHLSKARRMVAATLAGGVLFTLPALALAKHQLIPPGGWNAVGDCLGTDASPCIQWSKTAQNLSMNVDVYLSTKLSSEEVDLKTDARNSFLEYNPIAARNPHLQEIGVSRSAEIVISTQDIPFTIEGCTFGYTDISYDLEPGSLHRISHAKIYLNSRIAWNRSLTFSCDGASVGQADARKVMTHEMGHAEGLSHQAPGASSIMIQGALPYYHIGAADDNNIQLIYGSYP